MQGFGNAVTAILGAIITLAIVSVIVSRRSDSAGLVQSVGTSLAKVIAAATTPLPRGDAVVNVGGAVSHVNLQSLLHGDIDTLITPVF